MNRSLTSEFATMTATALFGTLYLLSYSIVTLTVAPFGWTLVTSPTSMPRILTGVPW